MSMRVAVVEDDSLSRLTLVAALVSSGFEVPLNVATAAEVLAHELLSTIRVFVLDLHLGSGPTGLDLALQLRRRDPSVGLVFLTSFDDPRLLSSSLPAMPGNAQYLVKKDIREIGQLQAAIVASAQGKKSNWFADRDMPTRKFTDVQIETLRLVAAGYSNAEIARQRFVTEKSVEVTIRRVAVALNLKHDATQNQRVHIAKVFFKATGMKSDLN
jgi:DNA-binding NarL/FixJ family response regulator